MTYLLTQIFYVSTRVASMVIFLCSIIISAYLSFRIMLYTTFLSAIYNFTRLYVSALQEYEVLVEMEKKTTIRRFTSCKH